MTHEYTTEDFLEAMCEEAHEMGAEKGIEQVARNALAEGISLETIQKITRLDVETIKNL